jgi:hypothetical protein
MVSLSTPVTGTGSVPPSLDMVPVPQYLHDAIVPHTKPQPPHTKFPRFDGENPKLWQKAADRYFRLFFCGS